MNEYRTGQYTNSNFEIIDFNYIYNPSKTKLQMFVDKVVEAVVNDGSYRPILRDIMFDFILITDFTDFRFDVDDDFDAESVERYLQENNIADVTKSYMGEDIISFLNNTVDDCIAYKIGYKPNGIMDQISKLIKSINDEINNVKMDDIAGFINRVNSMSEDITPEKIIEAYAKSESEKLDN